LRSRDHGCRFPGCNQQRFVDAHHVEHWAHGGETKLSNLVLLCRHHHRLVHEGGYRLERRRAGDVLFRRPDGRAIPASPLPQRGDHAAPARANHRAGMTIGPGTCIPISLGEKLDYGLAVESLLFRDARPPTAS
jgi:HNH endonuclease